MTNPNAQPNSTSVWRDRKFQWMLFSVALVAVFEFLSLANVDVFKYVVGERYSRLTAAPFFAALILLIGWRTLWSGIKALTTPSGDMKVYVTSHLPIPVETAWQLVKRSQTLIFVTRGVMGFRSDDFPAVWQQGQLITTRLYAFGLIPLWMHSLKFEQFDDREKKLSTNESGGLISVWNHVIEVEKESPARCKY